MPLTNQFTQFTPKHIGRDLGATWPLANGSGVNLFDLLFSGDGGAGVVMISGGVRVISPLYNPGGLGLNPGEIAFGGPTSNIIGSSELTFVSHVFEQQDSVGAVFVRCDGLATHRTFEIQSAAGNDAFAVSTLAGSQGVLMNGANGLGMIGIDEESGVGHRFQKWTDGAHTVADVVTDPTVRIGTDNTGRGAHWYDANGNLRVAFRSDALVANHFLASFIDEIGSPLLTINSRAAVRQISILNLTSSASLFNFNAPAAPSLRFNDDNGVDMFDMTLANATKAVRVNVPFTLGSFTVAALPSPPNGGNGTIAFASNARIGAEGAGAGTGSQVQYKTAGPAGAGWYIPGAIVLVTA